MSLPVSYLRCTLPQLAVRLAEKQRRNALNEYRHKESREKPKGRSNVGRPRKSWRDQLHLEDQGTGNTPKPSWTWWWWWWWWWESRELERLCINNDTVILVWKEILGVSVSIATTNLCSLTDSCLHSSTTLSLFRPITTVVLAGNFITCRKRGNAECYFVLCEYRHNWKSTTETVRTFN